MKLKLSVMLIVTVFCIVVLTPVALASKPEDAGLGWVDSLQAGSTCKAQADGMETMALTLWNNTDKDIYVAQVRWCKVGGFNLTDPDDWSSTGWWRIRPNSSINITALDKTGSFYIHAQHGAPWYTSTSTQNWPSSNWKDGYIFKAWVAPKSPMPDIMYKTSSSEASKQGYYKVYFMAIGTDVNDSNACDLGYWNPSTKTGWRINCRV
jgi:hypothetical protein